MKHGMPRMLIEQGNSADESIEVKQPFREQHATWEIAHEMATIGIPKKRQGQIADIRPPHQRKSRCLCGMDPIARGIFPLSGLILSVSPLVHDDLYRTHEGESPIGSVITSSPPGFSTLNRPLNAGMMSGRQWSAARHTIRSKT